MGKKGPPYDDDPECRYVVIEDPFPGHRTGKARDKAYWDWLGGWVYFMTGKKADAEPIYYVHTRDEVIVQLPEDFDINPILGVHVWREVLSWGSQRDHDRVSYVFEYNYRMRGKPDNHNWSEAWPAGGDPKDPSKFPVKFPYPRPHWATIRGRNCTDLALPLPKSRERTPTPPPPEPSLFEPYEAPAHLAHARDAHLEEESPEEEAATPPTALPLQDQLPVDKRDPYEEEDAAFRLVKQESVEPLHLKAEPVEPSVKQEYTERTVKHEDDCTDPQPSDAFVAAFYRLERACTSQGTSPTNQPHVPSPPSDNISERTLKREPSLPPPQQAFSAAFERQRLRAAQGNPAPVAPGSSDNDKAHTNQTQLTPTPDCVRSVTGVTGWSPERARSETWTPGPSSRVKPEPQEDMLPPPPPVQAQAQGPTRDPRLAARNMRVKPEPQDSKLPPPSHPTQGATRVKPEPVDHRMPPPTYARPPDGVRSQDPRQQSKLPSFKRVKREEDESTPKRIKTER